MSILAIILYSFLGATGLFVLIIFIFQIVNSKEVKRMDASNDEPLTYHERIFHVVAKDLMGIARLIKLSYHEINIIVFYFIIPFTWMVLLDLIFGFHYLKIGSLAIIFGFFISCRDFHSFSNNLYRKSVDFLNYFNRVGSNYTVSSVWICLVVPICIYGLLFYWLYMC